MTDSTTSKTALDTPWGVPAIPGVPSGGILSTVLGVAVTWMWVRRKYSRDSLEVTKDKTESDILTKIMAERDRAMEAAEKAWASRASDAQLIGKLSGEVMHLTQVNETLRKDVAALSKELKALRQIILASAPHPVAERARAAGNISPEEFQQLMLDQCGRADPDCETCETPCALAALRGAACG